MNKVYFLASNSKDYNEISAIGRALVEKIVAEKGITLQEHIPIKCHFGEEGNISFLPPKTYDGIIDFLEEKHAKCSYIETNALYAGRRMFKNAHIQLAIEHGFTRLPVIIADGRIGEHYYEEQIDKPLFAKCKIGAEYKNFSQIIVCSHFKGHIIAGFGGAIKQLAMGFAARGGKLEQHHGISPVVNDVACLTCGKCLTICSAGAITLAKTALIDQSKCIFCAGCIAICPNHAITFNWESENFIKKLAEYAFAATRNKNNIYVNFLCNITRDCDCMSEKMKPITDNIGVIASLDPVAVDTASLDILQKNTNPKLFDLGRTTLEYAESIGLGTRNYNLEILV